MALVASALVVVVAAFVCSALLLSGCGPSPTPSPTLSPTPSPSPSPTLGPTPRPTSPDYPVSVSAGDMHTVYTTERKELYWTPSKYWLDWTPAKIADNVVMVSLGLRETSASPVIGYVTEHKELYLALSREVEYKGVITAPVKIADSVVSVSTGRWNNGLTNHAAYVNEHKELYFVPYKNEGWSVSVDVGDPIKIADNVVSVSAGPEGWYWLAVWDGDWLPVAAYVTEHKELHVSGCEDWHDFNDWKTCRHRTVKFADNVVGVSVGLRHIAYITEHKELYTAGVNKYGQLGDGTTTDRQSPVKIADSVVGVSAGYQHTAYVTEHKELYTVGDNEYGQLGDGTTRGRHLPVKIADDVVIVSAGIKTTSYITDRKELYTVGVLDWLSELPSVPVRPVKIAPAGEEYAADVMVL